MGAVRDRIGSLLTFDFALFDWRDALRGALVTAAITSIPVIQGDPKAAIPLSIGAVFAAVAEAGQPFGTRWRTMLGTTATLMVAVYFGSLLSEAALLAILVTAPFAFACGLAGAIGKRAAVGGLLALVIFSIYVGVPVSMADAAPTAALLGLGGLIQTVVTVVMGVIRGQHRIPVAKDDTPSVSLASKLKNPVFLTHATRLAIVMTIATAISENFDIPHPYWLPMSVAWMSKPDHAGTVDRVTHRLVGTVLGLLVTAGIVFVSRPADFGFLALSLIGAAIAIAFIWANYAVAVAGVTIWVVSLFGMVGDPVVTTVDIRLLATVAAAVLVIGGMWLIPGFHQRQRQQAD